MIKITRMIVSSCEEEFLVNKSALLNFHTIIELGYNVMKGTEYFVSP
jgi:hypothetical protein